MMQKDGHIPFKVMHCYHVWDFNVRHLGHELKRGYQKDLSILIGEDYFFFAKLSSYISLGDY